ncbi:MAG: sugar transporter permease [Paenibacillaceae bacterium]|jgi:putative aldouronate transport system permease protein|nr:sugar transporter permease [Paenibacillaceae bacterium]
MGLWRELKTNRQLYLLAVPGVMFLLVFAYLPMFGHVIAFKRFNINKGLWGSDWVGFSNFKFFFMGQDWIRVTLNTIFLNSLFIMFGLGIALILAIFLNEIKSILFKRTAQSLIFMPYFISWVVVGLMAMAILGTTDGLLNKMLSSFGAEPIKWFSTPNVWPAILTIVYVWKQSGYYSIIFLAAITSISSEYYESARIDGATRFQQVFHITLPLIRPTLFVLALLAVGRIFYGDFGMVYGIVGDNGVLFPTTDIIDTYSFRALRQMGNFGMSSAVVLYQSFMGLITIVLFNGLVKRIDRDSALF